MSSINTRKIYMPSNEAVDLLTIDNLENVKKLNLDFLNLQFSSKGVILTDIYFNQMKIVNNEDKTTNLIALYTAAFVDARKVDNGYPLTSNQKCIVDISLNVEKGKVEFEVRNPDKSAWAFDFQYDDYIGKDENKQIIRYLILLSHVTTLVRSIPDYLKKPEANPGTLKYKDDIVLNLFEDVDNVIKKPTYCDEDGSHFSYSDRIALPISLFKNKLDAREKLVASLLRLNCIGNYEPRKLEDWEVVQKLKVGVSDIHVETTMKCDNYIEFTTRFHYATSKTFSNFNSKLHRNFGHWYQILLSSVIAELNLFNKLNNVDLVEESEFTFKRYLFTIGNTLKMLMFYDTDNKKSVTKPIGNEIFSFDRIFINSTENTINFQSAFDGSIISLKPSTDDKLYVSKWLPSFYHVGYLDLVVSKHLNLNIQQVEVWFNVILINVIKLLVNNTAKVKTLPYLALIEAPFKETDFQ